MLQFIIHCSTAHEGENVTTLEGSPLVVTKNATGAFLNDITCTDAAVTKADIEATNGIGSVFDVQHRVCSLLVYDAGFFPSSHVPTYPPC